MVIPGIVQGITDFHFLFTSKIRLGTTARRLLITGIHSILSAAKGSLPQITGLYKRDIPASVASFIQMLANVRKGTIVD